MVSDHASFVVETRYMPVYRSAAFRSFVGDTVLRYHHIPPDERGNAQLLLALLLGRMSDHVFADLHEYARLFEPNLNWLVLGREGQGVLKLGVQEGPVTVPAYRKPNVPTVGAGPVGLFSPRNQWLLKLLLMPGISPKYWGGPAIRPRTIGELAKASGVSQPSVSQFAAKAEAAGFLRRTTDGLRIVNHRELLDDWSYAIKHRPPKTVPVRPLYGREPEAQLLARLRGFFEKSGQGKPSICIGSHLACHLLGLGRSNNRDMVLYVDQAVEPIMHALELIPAHDGKASLRLMQPDFPHGVFGGCVRVDGLSLSDALQCYLEVRTSSARGREQADAIYHHVLAPFFESDL